MLLRKFLCDINDTRALIGLGLLVTSHLGKIRDPWDSQVFTVAHIRTTSQARPLVLTLAYLMSATRNFSSWYYFLSGYFWHSMQLALTASIAVNLVMIIDKTTMCARCEIFTPLSNRLIGSLISKERVTHKSPRLAPSLLRPVSRSSSLY